jgi:hypothetical protein
MSKESPQFPEQSTEADRPTLELHTAGDGRAFCRALARIIVRRELVSVGAIPDSNGCKSSPFLDSRQVRRVEGACDDRSHILPSVKE